MFWAEAYFFLSVPVPCGLPVANECSHTRRSKCGERLKSSSLFIGSSPSLSERQAWVEMSFFFPRCLLPAALNIGTA